MSSLNWNLDSATGWDRKERNQELLRSNVLWDASYFRKADYEGLHYSHRQDHSKASLIFWYIASPSISSVQCPNISSSFLRRLLQLSSRNLTTSCGRELRRGREILFLWAGVYSKKGRWIGTINGWRME